MRRIAALFRGQRYRRLAPYLLAAFGFLASTVEAAYQDAGALLEMESAATPRWMASVVAQPYGSAHAARVALPFESGDIAKSGALGVSMGSLSVPTDTVVLTGADAAAGPLVTGSVAGEAAPERGYPEVVRETKGDLMMSRAGFGERFRINPDAGGLMRIPRHVIDPPDPAEKPLLHSFMKVDPPKNGRPVMVASIDPRIGLDHVVAFQPLLTSPLEEVWRGRIEIDDFERDRHCLATAVYFEARGESLDGQRAVAQVVLNRVLDYRYPDTVCGVVFQNQTWHNRCQFSFACDGRPERVSDKGSWSTAVEVAEEALVGDYFDETIGEATHYHATYVRPRWSHYLRKVERVGTHIFYQLRPGQR